MSVHLPPITQRDLLPCEATTRMGKSHIRLRKKLARVDQLMAKIAEAHGLQYCALDLIAHSFLRLGQAVEGILKLDESYLQSLVQDRAERSCSQRTSTCVDPDDRAAMTETITGELLFLRQVTNDFVSPQDACRSYQTLMKQLEAMESVLDTYLAVATDSTISASSTTRPGPCGS